VGADPQYKSVPDIWILESELDKEHGGGVVVVLSVRGKI
jgi:hypothetical protein